MRFTTQLSQIFLQFRYVAHRTVHRQQQQRYQQQQKPLPPSQQQRIYSSSDNEYLGSNELCASPQDRSEASARNELPISEGLRAQIDLETPGLRLLEIASGTGRHCRYFAALFPNITFQPTEFNTKLFSNINANAATCPPGAGKILPPLFVDIAQEYEQWPEREALPLGSFDYMYNCNMVHITPWACSKGLFRAAAQLLKSRGMLFTYGPYAVHGVLTPFTNFEFDLSLSTRNPEWGVRDIDELKKVADEHGLSLAQTMELPSNNKLLTWRKVE